MKVKVPTTFVNADSLPELSRLISIAFDQVVAAINGRMDFVDNCQTSLVSATFTGSGQTLAVPHTLGKTPRGYIVAKSSANIVIYDGATGTNNETVLFLQSSGAGTVSLLVF